MRHRPEVERQLKALADATRLRILNLLRHGEICGRDLGYVLRLSQPNIAQHLAYLRHAGVVRSHRKGARVFYRLIERPGRVLCGLLDCLGTAFEREQVFARDTRRLKKAVLEGVFALGPAPRAARAPAAGRHAGQQRGEIADPDCSGVSDSGGVSGGAASCKSAQRMPSRRRLGMAQVL